MSKITVGKGYASVENLFESEFGLDTPDEKRAFERERLSSGGKISAVNWDEVMSHSSVTEVATMAPTNTSEMHDAKTDDRLLKNFEARAPRLRRILDLSMAVVNAKQ